MISVSRIIKSGWIFLLLSTVFMVPNDLFPTGIKNIFDGLRLLISIFIILLSIFFLARDRFVIKHDYSSALIIYLLFSLLAFFSGFYSNNPTATFGRGLEIMAASLFFVIILSRAKTETVATLWRITFIFLHLILLHYIVVSLVMRIPLVSISEGVYLWSGYGARNSITALGAVIFFVYLNRLLFFKVKGGKFFLYILGLLTAVLFIYISSSRTSILLVSAIIVPFLLWYHRSRFIVLLLMTVGFLTGIFIFQRILSFLLRGQSQEQVMGMSGRLDVWSAALDSFIYAPYFGNGYYASNLIAWSEFEQYGHAFSNIDNVFIETLLGTGIFGFLLISSFFIVSLKYVIKLMRKYRKNIYSDSIVPEMCCIVIFTFFRSFLNPTVQSSHWNLYLFVLALVYLYLKILEQRALQRNSNYI
jgi:O-antigen ligase